MPFSQSKLQDYMTKYGYVSMELPLVEPATLFLTKAGDQVIERLFTFDHRGKLLALRPEFTASAVYHYNTHCLPGDVVRWQFNGAIFEDRAGENQYQQQSIGAELIGLSGNSADAEIIGMAAHGLQVQGLADYQLIIGHVGLTRHLLKNYQLDDRALRFLLNHRVELQRSGKSAVMEALDRYLSTGTSTVGETPLTVASGRAMGGRSHDDIARRLGEKQRRSVNKAQILEALNFLETWGAISAAPDSAFSEIERFTHENETGQHLLLVWRSLIDLICTYGIPRKNISIQPDLARSWDYYTGIVFEIHTADSRPLAGGGRYDELTRLIGSVESTPAVGFAYYVDEIRRVLEISVAYSSSIIKIIGNESDAIVWAQRLREAGLVTVLQISEDDDQRGNKLRVMDSEIVELEGKRYSSDNIGELVKILEPLPL